MFLNLRAKRLKMIQAQVRDLVQKTKPACKTSTLFSPRALMQPMQCLWKLTKMLQQSQLVSAHHSILIKIKKRT